MSSSNISRRSKNKLELERMNPEAALQVVQVLLDCWVCILDLLLGFVGASDGCERWGLA